MHKKFNRFYDAKVKFSKASERPMDYLSLMNYANNSSDQGSSVSPDMEESRNIFGDMSQEFPKPQSRGVGIIDKLLVNKPDTLQSLKKSIRDQDLSGLSHRGICRR